MTQRLTYWLDEVREFARLKSDYRRRMWRLIQQFPKEAEYYHQRMTDQFIDDLILKCLLFLVSKPRKTSPALPAIQSAAKFRKWFIDIDRARVWEGDPPTEEPKPPEWGVLSEFVDLFVD